MNKKALTKALSVFISLLLCITVFAVIAKFTNNFSEDFKTFYVTYNDNKILARESKLFLSPGEEHVFEVTYTFEFLDEGEEGNTDYDVKIVPNVDEETDFTYTVDGNEYAYSSLEDLTKGFELKKYDTYFTLNLPQNMSLESVLENIYEKDVDAPKDEECPNSYLYTIVVSSYNESVVYYIDFNIVMDITLDKTGILF